MVVQCTCTTIVGDRFDNQWPCNATFKFNHRVVYRTFLRTFSSLLTHLTAPQSNKSPVLGHIGTGIKRRLHNTHSLFYPRAQKLIIYNTKLWNRIGYDKNLICFRVICHYLYTFTWRWWMPQQATTEQPAELPERNLSTVILIRSKVPLSPVLLSQEPHGIKSLELSGALCLLFTSKQY